MFYFRRLIFFLLCSILACSLAAQSVTVYGNVTDSISNERLEDATISLFQLPGPELVKRVRNRDGFSFNNLSKGDYILITSYQGFSTDTFHFSVEPLDSTAIGHDVLLNRISKGLLEVVVRATIPPVIVKNDTIAFNAAAYPSPPNSTVEDLLRKLPGVQIDKDGNVTMNGQKVDKITIDGKDFFLGDPKLASQNLPADIVAQVEAFDSQSKKAKLTGIKEQSKTKTLNIKLRKNRNQGYFGKVYAGGGTNNGYSVGGSVTRLAGEQMILMNANANNINNQFTGTEHANGAGNGLFSANNLQLNYRDKWTKNLLATMNAERTNSNIKLDQQLNRQTVLTDSSIIQNSITTERNRNTRSKIRLDLEYSIDSLTQLNLSSYFDATQSSSQSSDSVAISTQKASNKYLSSLGRTDNSSTGSGNNYYNALEFRRQFNKKGRLLYLNFTQSHTQQDQPAKLFSEVRVFDSVGNTLSNAIQNQESVQITSNNGQNLNVSYTEPVGKRHVLDFNYALNHSSGHSDKESFAYDSLTGKYDRLDSLTTNRFLNYTTVQQFSAGYNTTEGKYRFQIGLMGQLTQLSNQDQFSGMNFSQQTLNWTPRASLLWQMGKTKNMNLSYTGNTTTPTIDQLQPIPELTNPYLIKTGNPDLKQQLTHNLGVNYNSYNPTSFQNWQLSLFGSFSQNQITSSSTVLAGGVQEQQYVNVQGVFHLYSYITYGFPLGDQKNGNGSVSVNGQYGHDVSVINGQQNIAANESVSGLLNINFHVQDSLFINLGANISQGFSSYSLPGSPKSQTLNENFIIDFNYRLPWFITVASNYNLQVTGSQNNLPAQAVSLWSAAVYKSVFRNRGEVRVSGFDLLNSANSSVQSTGVNYVQTQKTNLPGRLLMLSLVWRFKHFGQG